MDFFRYICSISCSNPLLLLGVTSVFWYVGEWNWEATYPENDARKVRKLKEHLQHCLHFDSSFFFIKAHVENVAPRMVFQISLSVVQLSSFCKIIIIYDDIIQYIYTCDTHIYVYIYIYYILWYISWNPNDPCFDWKRPSFGGWPSKIGVIWVLGIHIYIIYIYVILLYIFYVCKISLDLQIECHLFSTIDSSDSLCWAFFFRSAWRPTSRANAGTSSAFGMKIRC